MRRQNNLIEIHINISNGIDLNEPAALELILIQTL